MKRTGFIGLGIMGSLMARSMVRAGLPLTVYDIRQDVVREFEQLGAKGATSPKDVAANSDVVVIMVVNRAQTDEVLFGENGVVHGMKKGGIVACSNTISPNDIKEIAAKLAAYGIRTLDSPVSGGVPAATTGTLTIMAGGPKDVLDDARGTLEGMAKRIFHVGEVGHGQILKIMNQLLVGVELVSIAEALVLGAKAGIDGQTLYDVITATSGNSEIFQMKAPKIIAGDFTPKSHLDIHVKDLSIVIDAADEMGVPLMLTNVAQQVLRTAQAMGKGRLDGSAVITVLEDIVGAKARRAGAA